MLPHELRRSLTRSLCSGGLAGRWILQGVRVIRAVFDKIFLQLVVFVRESGVEYGLGFVLILGLTNSLLSLQLA